MEFKKIQFGKNIFAVYREIPSLLDLSSNSCSGLNNIRQENLHSERMTVALLLKELFGYDSQLKHLASGAPYVVKNGEEMPPISISHCKGTAAVSYSDIPTGVDVEVIAQRVMRVRDRVFSDDELRFTGTSLKLNTLAWTAKEAVFKVIPEDGVDFKEDIILDLSKVEDKDRNEYTALAYGRKYKLTTVTVNEETLLTVAYECK